MTPPPKEQSHSALTEQIILEAIGRGVFSGDCHSDTVSNYKEMTAIMEPRIARLLAQNEMLRKALERCVERIDKLNTGGLDEPDPTVTASRAALEQTEQA